MARKGRRAVKRGARRAQSTRPRRMVDLGAPDFDLLERLAAEAAARGEEFRAILAVDVGR